MSSNGIRRRWRFFRDRIDKTVIERLQNVVDSTFARLDYDEAVSVLEHCGQDFEFPVAWGRDLQSEHERYLTERHVGGPVVVSNYPKDIKAFYMRLNDDRRTVGAMDVLVPGRRRDHRRQPARGTRQRARRTHGGDP